MSPMRAGPIAGDDDTYSMFLPLVLHRASMRSVPPTPPSAHAWQETRCDTIAYMGFNPFRKQQKSVADVAMVVGALILTGVAVAWAFLGG